MNRLPIILLLVTGAAVFSARMLTIWFFRRRVLSKLSASDSENAELLKKVISADGQVVPASVSSFYFLSGCGLIVTTLWGVISTAWWMLPLGAVAWYLAHRPLREEMEAWARAQKLAMIHEDAAALMRGGLAPKEEEALRKRTALPPK